MDNNDDDKNDVIDGNVNKFDVQSATGLFTQRITSGGGIRVRGSS